MSTPHCSLIAYLDSDTRLLESFSKDVTQFFLKFPLQYEVILVTHKTTTVPALPDGWRTVVLEKNEGRAQGLIKACSAAHAPYLAFVNIEMITPLGEVFKLLQNIMASPEVDMCWGNRYRKKESPFLLNATSRFRTEQFYNGILKERNSSPLEDFLSEAAVIKKTSFDKIVGVLPNLKNFWYVGPALLKAGQQNGFNIMPLPVFDSGFHPKGYSVWKERWNLLRQSSL